jgi:MFS family permease
VGALYVMGRLELWHMIVILLIHGFSGVIQMPSSQVLIYDLVGKDELPNALSLSAGSRYVAQFLGPILGGVLLVSVGPGWGLLANVLIYAPFTIALLMLKAPRSLIAQGAVTGWQGIEDGLNFARRNPAVRTLTLMAAIPAALIGFGYQALMPAAAAELGAGQAGYSWLLSANGIGAIAGAIILGYVGRVQRKGLLVSAATVLWAGFLLLFALAPWVWLAFGVLLLVGASNVVSVAMSQTLVQSLSPDDMRGRVVGVYSMAVFGPRVISGLALGALATVLGAHAAIGWMALGIVVLVGGLVLTVPTVRELD